MKKIEFPEISKNKLNSQKNKNIKLDKMEIEQRNWNKTFHLLATSKVQ